MSKWFEYRTGVLFAVLCGGFILASGFGPAAAEPSPTDEGIRVFKSANCVGCHKWSGVGGGGYGGAAANLRHTALSKDQIEQTIRCGRPATGMPHFDADAYTDGRCYGLKAANLTGGKMPPEPDHALRPPEIQAVTAYVLSNIKGKGDPDLAQCQAFFGTGTRVCDVYEKPGAAQTTAASSSGAAGSAPTSDPAAHQHLKVDAAPDANLASSPVRN